MKLLYFMLFALKIDLIDFLFLIVLYFFELYAKIYIKNQIFLKNILKNCIFIKNFKYYSLNNSSFVRLLLFFKTTHSVVNNVDATLDAVSSAILVTFNGSIIPASNISQ